MKGITLTKQLALLLGLLVYSVSLLADEFRARIVRIQGEVYIVNQQGEQRSPDKTKNLVNRSDTVVTGDDSKAVVQFDDGAMSVLDEKSRLRVEQSGWLSQLSGKVYYLFRKVLGKNQPRKVSTKFATIGIRGTSFIVYENDEGQGVALQDGRLNIESPAGDYEIHRLQQADDFESFKQQMRDSQKALEQEYRDYRDNMAREFVEYKKSFDLQPNRVVRFDGNRVEESELSESMKSQFDGFEAFAGRYIEAYRELDDSTE